MRPLCDTVHPRPHCVGIKIVPRVELETKNEPSRSLKLHNQFLDRAFSWLKAATTGGFKKT